MATSAMAIIGIVFAVAPCIYQFGNCLGQRNQWLQACLIEAKMSIKQIRDILTKHKKNIVDVAAATKLNPATVRRYICGLSHHATTEFLVMNYCKSLEDEHEKRRDLSRQGT